MGKERIDFNSFLGDHSNRFQHPEKQAKLTIILRDMWELGQRHPDIYFNEVNTKEVLTEEGRAAYLDLSTADSNHFNFLLLSMKRAFDWGAGKGNPHSPSSTFLELNTPQIPDFNRFWEEHSDRAENTVADDLFKDACRDAFLSGASGGGYAATVQRLMMKSKPGGCSPLYALCSTYFMEKDRVLQSIRRAFEAGRGLTPETPKTVYKIPERASLNDEARLQQDTISKPEPESLEGISYPDLFMLIFNSSTDHRYILELARRIDGQLRGHSVHCSGTTYSFMKKPPTAEPCEVCATAAGARKLLENSHPYS